MVTNQITFDQRHSNMFSKLERTMGCKTAQIVPNITISEIPLEEKNRDILLPGDLDFRGCYRNQSTAKQVKDNLLRFSVK